MRRWLAVALSVAGILGFLAPTADAQAPKVTINGLVDNVTSWSRNMSVNDQNYDRTDTEWYARTRVRPDITAEVGTTKFVLGIEIDAVYGQFGAADATGAQHFGARGGFDLNTDLPDMIEIKWAYTEFDMPWVPGSRLRLGAQPWATTYKGSVLATGDFSGVNWTWSITPAIRTHLAYAQVEEEKEPSPISPQRGEDWAVVASVEITPFKGLDIRPIFAYFGADGVTSGAARSGKGGVHTTNNFVPQDHEHRYTIGVDSRLRLGPVSIDPTVFYQFGNRDVTCTGAALGCPASGKIEQDFDAWFVDLRGGFQAGPLLIEGAFIYTTGNKASDNLRDDVEYYQPISTDSGYYATWAQISALDIDYFNQLYYTAAGLSPGQTISYDKYGLLRVGARASYAITPAFSVRAGTTLNWTDKKVDTSSSLNAASGLTPGDGNGDSRWLGWEIMGGLTWRLAPNLVFDLVGAHLFAGNALERAGAPEEEDVSTVAARFRFTF